MLGRIFIGQLDLDLLRFIDLLLEDGVVLVVEILQCFALFSDFLLVLLELGDLVFI